LGGGGRGHNFKYLNISVPGLLYVQHGTLYCTVQYCKADFFIVKEGEVVGNDKVKDNCVKICKEVIWYVEVRAYCRS
jgi:hypothetical protein